MAQPIGRRCTPERSRCWREDRCGEVGRVLLISLALMVGSVWAAWAWQANAYGKQLAVQEATHQTALPQLANSNAALVPAEHGSA